VRCFSGFGGFWPRRTRFGESNLRKRIGIDLIIFIAFAVDDRINSSGSFVTNSFF
jgi:hypothetical protein